MLFSEGPSVYAEGLSDYAEGPSDYAEGLSDYAEGLSDYAEGLSDYAEGPSVYAEGPSVYADTERLIQPLKTTHRFKLSQSKCFIHSANFAYVTEVIFVGRTLSRCRTGMPADPPPNDLWHTNPSKVIAGRT